MEDKDDSALMCEHIKNVLDAYLKMVTQEQGSEKAKDYKERFYELVNYKI